MIRFKYNGELAPMLQDIGFIKAPINKVVEAYTDWIDKLEQGNFRVKELTGVLKEVVLPLQPLANYRKRIFIPTKSNWVAYTDSVLQPEINKVTVLGKRLNCETMQASAYFNDRGTKNVNGWGGGSFTYYKGSEFQRLVYAMWDDKWVFGTEGVEPLPFEETETYNEKFARNRFTPEMFDRYLKNFGIDFFNEDFYMPEGSKAYLFELKRDLYPNEKEMTLEQVRQLYKLT